MNIRNPFRNESKSALFRAGVRQYESKGGLLFAYTTSGVNVGRAGNSWSAAFWAGFDGMTSGVRVPEKSVPLYGLYAAGRAIGKHERSNT